MSFSTVNDVRAIIDTDMTDQEITSRINMTDALIGMRLNTGSLPGDFLTDLSSTRTAYRCMLKDPESRALGEYREDRSQALKSLKEDIDEMWEAGSGGIAVVATRSELQ